MALKFPDILEHNNSNLPLVDITELKGNSYPLATLAETGSIPSSKRKVGAIIFVSSSQEFYGFYGQTTSSADWGTTSNWRLFPTTTGSFTGSFNGSFTGRLLGTASWAINAATASYVPASAVVGLNLSQIATGSITASVSLDSPIAFSIISGSSILLSVNTASLTTIKNLTVTDNLVVNGTASFINTENLLVKDPFILINSGSNSLTDSGIVSQYNSFGEGSAFYIEGTDTGTYGRWAVAYGVQQGFVSVTADEYVVTAKKASGAPPAEPTWGGSTNGFGNIYVNSDNGDIFIYS